MVTAPKLYGTCEIDQCSQQQVVLAYTFNTGQKPHALSLAIKDAQDEYNGNHPAAQVSTVFREPDTVNPRGMLIIKGYQPVNGAKIKDFTRNLVAVGALDWVDRNAVEDRINKLPDPPPRRSVVGRY